jgi:hypothetical protein
MTKSIKIARQTAHETERYTCPQAVVWCGFDENLEQGARCKSSTATAEIRACLWKILQRNFPQRRSSRSMRLKLTVCASKAPGLRASSSTDSNHPSNEITRASPPN